MGKIKYKEYGKVIKIKGCIVTLSEVENCINGQLVKFGFGTEGIVIGFNENETQILIVKEKGPVKPGEYAEMTMEPFNTPVGESFIGRIVNVLGEPLDNLGQIQPQDYYPIFASAPPILDRDPVGRTLETGIKILDTMIPIGKGQRQLILGDKMTGKTTLGTDIILNQKGKNVICIYCLIGKSKSALERVVNLFKSKDVFKYTIIVAALAGTSPGQQYLAPYVSCSLGEYFMYKGGDVVVVFDDFTRHAWAYREMSLLLERPPGRESYPGDVFYLHSQMIERAAQLSKEKGGGSMSFFPIIELLEGDLTGYISTNLVSMTDGQIYLSAPLFGEGFRPAIDLGLSVSRIGSKVQWSAIKKLSKSLRLEYLQYRDLLKISRLKTSGQRTEESVEQMKGGEILSILLTQHRDVPVPMVEQVILFYGLAKKILYNLDKEDVEIVKNEIYKFACDKYPKLVEEIETKKDLTEEIEKELDNLYDDFIKSVIEKAQRVTEEEEEGVERVE